MDKPGKIIAIAACEGSDERGPCGLLAALDFNGAIWRIAEGQPPRLIHKSEQEDLPWSLCLIVGLVVGLAVIGLLRLLLGAV